MTSQWIGSASMAMTSVGFALDLIACLCPDPGLDHVIWVSANLMEAEAYTSIGTLGLVSRHVQWNPWTLYARIAYTGPGTYINHTIQTQETLKGGGANLPWDFRAGEQHSGDFSGFSFGLIYPRLVAKEASNSETPMGTKKSKQNPI